MDDNEIEKKLKESVENIQTREFSLVWGEIKHRVESPRKRKRYSQWAPLVASVASVVVACAIIIPIALQQNQHQASVEISSSVQDETESSSELQVYFSDELIIVDATTEEFFDKITFAGLKMVDVSKYMIVSSLLFETQDGVVKGGQLELTDDLESSTCYFNLALYEESVTIEEQLQIEYDYSYTVNNAAIQYRIKEVYPEDGIYIYNIEAKLNSITYIIEYTCFDEDIKPFLNEFFNN